MDRPGTSNGASRPGTNQRAQRRVEALSDVANRLRTPSRCHACLAAWHAAVLMLVAEVILITTHMLCPLQCIFQTEPFHLKHRQYMPSRCASWHAAAIPNSAIYVHGVHLLTKCSTLSSFKGPVGPEVSPPCLPPTPRTHRQCPHCHACHPPFCSPQTPQHPPADPPPHPSCHWHARGALRSGVCGARRACHRPRVPSWPLLHVPRPPAASSLSPPQRGVAQSGGRAVLAHRQDAQAAAGRHAEPLLPGGAGGGGVQAGHPAGLDCV